jgi:Protein of unknown function (DUF2911)
MFLRVISAAACTAVLAATSLCQATGMNMPANGAQQPMPSPAASASVTLAGQTVTINYHAPSLRNRHVGGPEIVPWNTIWRTGANDATALVTPVPLHIGTLLVPPGNYTVYTLPTRTKWMLIISKETGQWGTEYHAEKDLGRVELKSRTLPSAQEVMSISFDDIKKDSAELHIRWETADESVKVSTP